MKSRILILLTAFFAISSCISQSKENIKTVSVEEFAANIKKMPNAQILDVRTPEEFAEGHIQKAANVNWTGSTFVKDAEKFNKEKPVFVYCRSGRRSMEASKKLQELGFKKIYNLDGGFMNWQACQRKNMK